MVTNIKKVENNAFWKYDFTNRVIVTTRNYYLFFYLFTYLDLHTLEKSNTVHGLKPIYSNWDTIVIFSISTFCLFIHFLYLYFLYPYFD